MANSYNISVAPEVAAVKVVVDAIRATDFPLTDGLVATVGTEVAAIRDTDVVVIRGDIAAHKAETDATGVIVADMHDTDLPAIKAHGQLISFYDSTGSLTWVSLLEVTGSGIIHSIGFYSVGNTGGAHTKIEIDGIMYELSDVDLLNNNILSFVHVMHRYIAGHDRFLACHRGAVWEKDDFMIPVEFNQGFNIWVKNYNATPLTGMNVIYALD